MVLYVSKLYESFCPSSFELINLIYQPWNSVFLLQQISFVQPQKPSAIFLFLVCFTIIHQNKKNKGKVRVGISNMALLLH